MVLRYKRFIYLFFFIILINIFSCQKANADGLALFYIKPDLSGRLPLNSRTPSIVSLIATGDLMMTARVDPFIREYGVHYPFDKTRLLLQNADLAIANLEAPFSNIGSPFKKKYTFRTPPHYIAGICSAGIDVLTLANNHIMDYGIEGLKSTLSLLKQNNLYYCGAGLNRMAAEKPVLVQLNENQRIAFVAYSLTYPDEFWAKRTKPGTAFPIRENLKKQIHHLKAQNYFVVISFHWGGERLTAPKFYQKDFAHFVVDHGADFVIGHHPHVLQGLEVYKNKLIAYSLGNYIFGSYSNTVDYSVLLKVWFDQEGPLLAALYPIDINNYRVEFQPELVPEKKKIEIFNYLNKLSKPLNQNRLLIDSTGCIRLR